MKKLKLLDKVKIKLVFVWAFFKRRYHRRVFLILSLVVIAEVGIRSFYGIQIIEENYENVIKYLLGLGYHLMYFHKGQADERLRGHDSDISILRINYGGLEKTLDKVQKQILPYLKERRRILIELKKISENFPESEDIKNLIKKIEDEQRIERTRKSK